MFENLFSKVIQKYLTLFSSRKYLNFWPNKKKNHINSSNKHDKLCFKENSPWRVELMTYHIRNTISSQRPNKKGTSYLKEKKKKWIASDLSIQILFTESIADILDDTIPLKFVLNSKSTVDEKWKSYSRMRNVLPCQRTN